MNVTNSTGGSNNDPDNSHNNTNVAGNATGSGERLDDDDDAIDDDAFAIPPPLNVVGETTAPTTLPPATAAPTRSPTISADIPPFSIRMVQARAPRDAFGSGLALSGDGMVMAVGAPKASVRMESTDTGATSTEQTTSNGTTTTESAANITTTTKTFAGIVSVYRLQSMTTDSTGALSERWQQQGNLLVGEESSDYFGTAVATNYDGSLVIVGEPGDDGSGDRAGQVQAFIYTSSSDGTSGAYQRIGSTILGPSAMSHFGSAIAASQNGNRIAIGAPYFTGDQTMQGLVSVFELVNNQWQAVGQPLTGLGPFDWLGSAVDLSPDGTVLVASAPHDAINNGYVMAWRWDGSTWNPLGSNGMINTLSPATSTDRYGHSVSIDETDYGTYRVAIGVPSKQVGDMAGAGVVLVYEYSESEAKWRRVSDPAYNGVQGEEFGSSVKLAMNGNKLVVGAPGYNNRAGLVTFYHLDSTLNIWSKSQQKVKGANPSDEFGKSIAIAEPIQNGRVSVAVSATAEQGLAPGYVLSFTQQDTQ